MLYRLNQINEHPSHIPANHNFTATDKLYVKCIQT